MQDRVSLYPGRVMLTPVPGQENTFDLVRADQPTQEGTPLNKATLLKDVTASILGLPNTAVPDDAFLALTIGVGTYGYRVKIQLADGTPVEGATVSGITALTGSTLVSGADGIVLGKSTSKTVTISCTSPYIDQAAPASQSVTATETITDVTLTLTSITDMITVTSSKTTKVSPMAKTMDVTAVGGGGGGGGNSTKSGVGPGGGGGGGYVKTKLTVPRTSVEELTIIVGSAGAVGGYGSSGGGGGSTTIKSAGTDFLVANGGSGGVGGNATNAGGVGNGNGGQVNVSNGGDGVGYIFDDTSLGLAGGGGGGGGKSAAHTTSVGNLGGNPYGGDGALAPAGTLSGSNATPAKGYGGGGGGGYYNKIASSGASGCVYIRFHF